MDEKLYYVYIIRCIDGSLYTGITTDIQRRFSEHTSRRSSGEKYTRSRRPVSIESTWICCGRSTASKLEYAIKKLTRQNKENLIKHPASMQTVFGDSINAELYKYTAEFKESLIN